MLGENVRSWFLDYTLEYRNYSLWLDVHIVDCGCVMSAKS